jgi:hypothetical protein
MLTADDKVAEVFRLVRAALGLAEARLPLDWLVEAICPGCRDFIFTTVGQQIVWERERGEPVALTCSDRCAVRVAVMLARTR